MTAQTKSGTPTTCHVCQRHAIGVGIGDGKDPKYLCQQCVGILEHIKRVQRLDVYELQALDGAVDAVGEFIASNDNKTELADYGDLEQRMLCKAAIEGFGNRLRQIIEKGEAPF